MTRPLLVGALLACALNASCALFRQAETPDYGRALPAGADALLLLGPDERRPDVRGTWFERDEIMPALERSLAWTRSLLLRRSQLRGARSSAPFAARRRGGARSWWRSQA